MVTLPLGLAYAIVRYDMMALDVLVRRLSAMALGGLLLIGLTVVAALALQPLASVTVTVSVAVPLSTMK